MSRQTVIFSKRCFIFVFFSAVVLAPAQPALAGWCWWYNDMAYSFQPAGGTTVGDAHHDWHSNNPPVNNAAYGRAFLAFHRQFILDYDIFRINSAITDSNGILLGRLEPWDAFNGVLVPGNDEGLGEAFTHCSTNTDRPANSVCTLCEDLPCFLRVAPGGPCISPSGETKLGDYNSLGEVGAALEFNWHGSYHGGVGALGCPDVASTQNTPRDPAFWMAHKKLDEVSRDWLALKAADVVIVLDRSGSMDDNCSVPNNPPPDETPCKINDAREAARLFADLVQDVRMENNAPAAQQHMIGLVSFSTTATKHLGGALIPASGIVTDDGMDNTPFENALGGISTGGGTSIGDGIDKALEVLATGSNPHQVILVLTDGFENTAPLIDDVKGSLGDVQLCAIGYGDGALEDKLREVAEMQGGIMLADPDLSDDGLTLEKFFVDCFGQIYDSAIAEDPVLVMLAGDVSSGPIPTEVCATAGQLTYVLGRERFGNDSCDLRLKVTTPQGNLVDLTDSSVETGHGPSWDFVRISLPYRGEIAGTWTAYAVRPQQIYTHGFVTDAFADMEEGINLVRREIHRLCPQRAQVLYYEDGSVTGNSAYREALDREQAAGTLSLVKMASSADEFAELLIQNWDLIVFARQMDPKPQVYDDLLADKLCQGQKALITDFSFGTLAGNPVLPCAGISRGELSNWQTIVGDGTLVTGQIQLKNPGYTLFSYDLSPVTFGGPWKVQATNESQGGSIVGTGTSCGKQTYFYSTMVNSFGRVQPFVGRPRVHVGHKLLATFRITESNRPVGDWDQVNATVVLTRPGGGPVENYPLFDDGTNGDRLAGNHVWSYEVPGPVSAPGPYLLQGKFDLTKDGCTIHRETEYSIIVDFPPQSCSPILTCAESIPSYRGAVEEVELACAVNLCAERDYYQVKVEDSEGWLCTVDPTGAQIPIPVLEYQSDGVDVGRGLCLFDHPVPLFICIPLGATIGDSTIVTHKVTSLNTGKVSVCQTRVRVTLGEDCNNNGQHDLVDIATGESLDMNENGIPDDCERCLQDLNGDGHSNLLDFGVIGIFWLQNDCSWPDWCQGTDNNESGGTDTVDLGRFFEHWLEPCDDHQQ